MKKVTALLVMAFTCLLLSMTALADDGSPQNGVVPYGDGWYYVLGGEVQYGYTGLASNEYGTWYISSGKVDFGVNDILFLDNNGDWGWWNIRGGHVVYADDVAPNGAGWWYCRNGKVDFDYTGIKPNGFGWWRIVNGMVDFGCNSIEQNEYGWWYIEGGCVRFDYYGTATNGAGLWIINGGNVTFAENGLVYVPADNAWYLADGSRVKTEYTGAALNDFGTWYVKNGRVSFETNGYAYLTLNGETGNWVVVNGLITNKMSDDEASRLAAEALNRSGWDLYAAYSWVVNNISYTSTNSGMTTSSAAVSAFNSGYGDCIGFASTFCYMARVLGYECYVLYGEVPYAAGGYGDHAWCEIMVDGNYYWVDTQFARQTGYNGYLFNYGQSGTWVYRNWNRLNDF